MKKFFSKKAMPSSRIFEGRTFGWAPNWDSKNYEYLVRDLVRGAAPVPSAYDRLLDARLKKVEAVVFPAPTPPGPTPTPTPIVLWDIAVTLDQGQEGECVGHGWEHWRFSNPKPMSDNTAITDNPNAERIYERAQQIDGQAPDEQSGTSVLAGAKAAKELGGMASYHWALTIADVVNAVSLVGPVVIGIPWTDAMMNPDTKNHIHATGNVVGGHCLVVRGYDPTTKLFRLHNSWGSGWGLGGDAFISSTDLASLLAQNGEACVAVKV